jgi:NitT/TauT family transport system ATP-binding protein
MAEATTAALPARETLVDIAALELSYAASGNAPMHGLSDINRSVGKGDFVSLIGPSGCGKSTLLRIVGDLLTPTSGVVSIVGQRPRQARLHRKVGLVHQLPEITLRSRPT